MIETCTNNYNVKLNAGEMTIKTIMELFNLKKSQNDWTLAESSLVPDVPKRLSIY